MKNKKQKHNSDSKYETQINLAINFFEKKRFEECIQTFEGLFYDLKTQKDLLTSTMEIRDLELLIKRVKNLIGKYSIKIADDFYTKKMNNEAFSYYKTAILYNPENPTAYINMAECLNAAENYPMALKCYEEALKISPGNELIHKLIGDICYLQLKDYEKAIKHYEIYLKTLKPSKLLGHVYNILGKLYELTNRDIYAQILYFEKAFKLIPESRSVIKNLTIVYPKVGRLQETLNLYINLFDNEMNIEEKVFYGFLQIQNKNFEEGWKYYELRFEDNDKVKYPSFEQPIWTGEKINDKTLLVHWEQGFGDTIMFCRYLNQLKEHASKIIFRVQDELFELMKSNLHEIEVYSSQTPISDIKFDYHVPLMSLMHYLNTTYDKIPCKDAYICANKDLIQKYKKEYFNNDKLKVGISWHGSRGGSNKRNIPLKNFLPVINLENAQIYSFQKGDRAEDLNTIPNNIIDLGKTFNDFSDTAAALANLDFLVTSDNAVFNLAASMGVKTILLLNKNAEWRWFLDEKTTPWYNSVEIFKKQKESDSWDDLIKEVANKLKKSI